jgi:hypothetical protein
MAGGIHTLLGSDFVILTLLEGLHCEDAPVTVPITIERSCAGRRHTITWASTGADSYELYHGETLLYSGPLLTFSYTLTRAELPFSQTYTLLAINECGESEEVGTIAPLYTNPVACDTDYTSADSCDTDYSAPLCDEP